MTRDEKGRFPKGVTGNPKGRPKKERERRFLEITQETVTFDDWREIIIKTKEQAKRGDPVARKFLAEYLIGPPVQKGELTGENGGAIVVRVEYVGNDNEPQSA